MTNADYVAIAVSPALVMALVGSLVFFLIEVLYVGSYPARLNYVFALFVFATVLIARISIEFGSERAAMFSLPLGILVYLALMRFVEHPGSLSWLINLILLTVVWWCAHKLTWDCTLIDDNEDASGEGLLGRVGLDETDEAPQSPAAAAADNELFANSDAAVKPSSWRRLFLEKSGPHMPGLWVLYFSLTALPLFGIGQKWIPPSEVGRRRYAFALLAVYVAAALSLLVTTSFLGLRRYLRQRRVEMPGPMAATWVSLGAVLILLVMFAAALLPRPNAEYALSQAPWRAAAPGDLEASDYSVGQEGANDPSSTNRQASNQPNAPPGTESGGEQDPAAEGESAGNKTSKESDQAATEAQSAEGSTGEPGEQPSGEPPTEGEQGRNPSESDDQPNDQQQTQATETSEEPQQGRSSAAPDESSSEQAEAAHGSAGDSNSSMSQAFEHVQAAPAEMLQTMSLSLANALKWLFYAIVAGLIAYFAWTRREDILRATADLIQQLREFWARLFGRPAPAGANEEEAAAAAARRRTFREFTDPFASGRSARIPAVELVRYTFEAFEAWAGDRGRPRSPDQTPQELVRGALPPQSPMYAQAQQLVQLYNQAAYSSASVSREAASGLQRLWQMMRSTPTNEANPSPSPSLRGRGKPDA
jgi:hypothetical protein